MPATLRERQTLLKLLSAGFHNSSVAHVANAALGIPAHSLESTVLVSCSCQLMSLSSGANHFFAQEAILRLLRRTQESAGALEKS